jgi:hypothetical protein
MRWTLFAVVVLGLFANTGCKKEAANQSAAPAQPAAGPQSAAPAGPVADDPSKKPAFSPGPATRTSLPAAEFTTTAEAFAKEADADPKTAARKYANKVVEVSGTVGEIGFDYKRPDMVLWDPKFKSKITVLTKHPRPWTFVGPGQAVTVRGIGNPNLNSNLLLIDCEFVTVGPSKTYHLTSEEVAKRFANGLGNPFDADSTDSSTVITGLIESISGEGDAARTVFFKGADGVKVSAKFRRKDEAAGLKVGQAVSFFARGTPVLTPGTRSVEFFDCLVAGE